jgi:hypothetical protein
MLVADDKDPSQLERKMLCYIVQNIFCCRILSPLTSHTNCGIVGGSSADEQVSRIDIFPCAF